MHAAAAVSSTTTCRRRRRLCVARHVSSGMAVVSMVGFVAFSGAISLHSSAKRIESLLAFCPRANQGAGGGR